MERYDDSILTRKNLLEDRIVEKYKNYEPLKKCVFNMYKNIAGCYQKIHKENVRPLSYDELKYCGELLSKAVNYFDKDTDDYEQTLERLEWVKSRMLQHV